MLERRSRLKAFSSGALFRGCLSLVFWCAGVGFSPCLPSFAAVPSAHISPSFVSVLGSGLDSGSFQSFGVSGPVLPKPFGSANTTELTLVSSLINLDSGVLRSVLVPVLTCLGVSKNTPPSVFGVGYRIKMVWVATRRISTEMVKHKPLWNWPSEQLEGSPVDGNHLALLLHIGVSQFVDPSCPIPTPSLGVDGDVVQYELGGNVVRDTPPLVPHPVLHGATNIIIRLLC